MRVGGIAPVILGFIDRCGPLSGYEIKGLVDSSTRFFWAASYGQIYPELHRLEAAGLIVGESSPRGGRQRNVYSLTPAGAEALRDWLEAPEVGAEVRDLGLLKAFFGDRLGAEGPAEIARRVCDDRAAVLERLRAVEREVGAEAEGGSALLVLEFGLDLYEFITDWWARAEARLAEPRAAAS